MGLSLLGSIFWLLGVFGSLLWPAFVALAVARWSRPPPVNVGRFLGLAIPLSYLVILGSHSFLADIVLLSARRAAETGVTSIVWSRIILVLLTETVLAVLVLSTLRIFLDRRPRRR
ncbi:MAG: hypothetical protein ACR2QB_05970 [Gammaproteobacteria bacterium]